MFKALIRATAGLTVGFGLLTTVSLVAGHAIDAPLAAALILPQRDSPYASATIGLFDLQRGQRLDLSIPDVSPAEMLHIDLIETLPSHVMVETQSANPEAKHYQASLYLYDYLSGRLTTITTVDSERPFRFSSVDEAYSGGIRRVNRLFYDYAPFVSPNGAHIAFVNPLHRKPYLFDLWTNQVSLLADLEIYLGEQPNLITWSPDNTKIAVKDHDIMYIFSLGKEGSQPVELQRFDYSAARANFTVDWSADSQYLLLQRYTFDSPTENAPLRVLDVVNGSEHPFVQDLSAHWSSWWSCDGRWLYYVIASAQQNEGYLLNLQTGETIRVNDTPALADVPISSIYPIADCDQFLIEAHQAITVPVQDTTQAIYVFDVASRSAALVDDNILTYRFTEDALYYIKLGTGASQNLRLSRSINPQGQIVPLDVTFPITAIWKAEDSILTFDYFDGRQSSEWPGGELGILDLSTASFRMLTTVDEVVLDHQRFRRSEIRNQP